MKKIILACCLLGLFACNHNSNIDPTSYLLNLTSETISVRMFAGGAVLENYSVAPREELLYCTCQAKLNFDSTLIQQASGDFIIYHAPDIENSNYEQTKNRSPFTDSNWGEVRENNFQYQILPGDFQ